MDAHGLSALLVALAVAGCGGGGDAASGPAATAGRTAGAATGGTVPRAAPRERVVPSTPDLGTDVRVRFAGSGARGAWVLRPRGRATRGTVLFLHGWTAADPRLYGPWLRHLVRRGSVVIYPVYQSVPFLSVDTAFANVIAGVRAALRDETIPRRRLTVAGHSAGGAMSADYAASAARLGLPRARTVFAAYPGRMIRRIPLRLPSVPLDSVPPDTRVVALYGTDDRTVGDTEARRIVRAPGRTTLVAVDDPAVDDHLGPQRAGPATRRLFWRRLDALVPPTG